MRDSSVDLDAKMITYLLYFATDVYDNGIVVFVYLWID